MQHKLLIPVALAAALGLSAWTAVADPAAGDHPPPPGIDAGPGHFGPPGSPGGHHDGAEFGPPGDWHGEGRGPGPMGHMGGPAGEVLQTLHQIEQLYREQGKTREVIALYQDVLGKTKDPLVRHAAYEAIAHAQMQPADTDKAIATLKQSLDEGLQRLNQMPPPPGPGAPPHEGKAAQ